MTYEIIPLPKRAKDITGQTFGRLTVIGFVGMITNGLTMWLCICDCGSETIVVKASLNNGSTKSCGCLHKEITAISSTTHGMHKAAEYRVWDAMIQRCTNPNNKKFENYGGRGITICKKWLKFDNFISDMGKRPSNKHTIDRINNDGCYAPDNCHWITQAEQMRNTRRNHVVTFVGKTQCLTDWAIELGMNPQTLFTRVRRGWSIERAFTEPVGHNRSHIMY